VAENALLIYYHLRMKINTLYGTLESNISCCVGIPLVGRDECHLDGVCRVQGQQAATGEHIEHVAGHPGFEQEQLEPFGALLFSTVQVSCESIYSYVQLSIYSEILDWLSS
jgi:hypothetical protein